MYNLNGFAFNYKANLHPVFKHFQNGTNKIQQKLIKIITIIIILYNLLNSQGLLRKLINAFERNKTTINKFCSFVNYLIKKLFTIRVIATGLGHLSKIKKIIYKFF